MQQRNAKKKAGAILLAVIMTVSVFPQFGKKAHAAENQFPDTDQFATAEQLKTFNTNDADGTKQAAKVYFGDNSQQWWIAGHDTKSQKSDTLVLFSAGALATIDGDSANKKYDSDWGCVYEGNAPSEVYWNHYGGSKLRKKLKELEETYFTPSETSFMNQTTVYTKDLNNNQVYYTTDKLYLAHGDRLGLQYITVGNSSANLNQGLRIDNTYWEIKSEGFWLRTPIIEYNNQCMMDAYDDIYAGIRWSSINIAIPEQDLLIMPAFELNTSSVLFASAAKAASSDGALTVEDVDKDGAFTLRYSASDLGTAKVSASESKVNLTGVSDGTYLVVQNSKGAYAKRITTETSVSAKEMGLDNFESCSVWLEKTDSAERITYAALATEEQTYTVGVTISDGMTVASGNLTQQVGENQKMDDIVIRAQDGYIFPESYGIQSQSGITVTRDSETCLIISGTPTADVNMTLPPATKKAYGMTLNGDGTFGAVCEGYASTVEKEFTITNNGNVNLENVRVSITGTDAAQFVLGMNPINTIQPGGTIRVTVAPKDNLPVKEYQAELSVSADNVNTAAAAALQFTVRAHEYQSEVTPSGCTAEGYTTYTCKNCGHSYTGDPEAAAGHNFGEWKIIRKTAAACEKERTCKRCGHKESKVVPMVYGQSNPDNSKNNKPDINNDSVQTGDQTNLNLYIALLAISGLFIAILAVWKKKRR